MLGGCAGGASRRSSLAPHQTRPQSQSLTALDAGNPSGSRG